MHAPLIFKQKIDKFEVSFHDGYSSYSSVQVQIQVVLISHLNRGWFIRLVSK